MSETTEDKSTSTGSEKVDGSSGSASAKSNAGQGPSEKRPAPSRRTVYILFLIMIIAGAFLVRQTLFQPKPAVEISSVTVSGKPKIGGPFTLVDHNGRTVTQADFAGKHMLVFFGYTFCPDVCPTTLSTIADALDMLGNKASAVTPVFITVDPERDTPEQMKMYISYFHPQLVGLSGSMDQVKAAASTFKAYFAKADTGEADDDDYLMDHSSITYLMGPDGKFVSHFSHGVEASEMAKRLAEILK